MTDTTTTDPRETISIIPDMRVVIDTIRHAWKDPRSISLRTSVRETWTAAQLDALDPPFIEEPARRDVTLVQVLVALPRPSVNGQNGDHDLAEELVRRLTERLGDSVVDITWTGTTRRQVLAAPHYEEGDAFNQNGPLVWPVEGFPFAVEAP